MKIPAPRVLQKFIRFCYTFFLTKTDMPHISYDPLWKKLIDKKLNRLELSKQAGFSTATLAKLGKNQYVALSVLERICHALDCPIEDVVEVLPKEEGGIPGT